ncbi:hypothetical protein ABZ128_16425 [Streptomyces sp. NPDC006326]|uniref:hypothetical protein n=1 Tax=Streptomyces sp. NPDC006326 TaxID=3156752 RepID=UPI0033AAAD28
MRGSAVLAPAAPAVCVLVLVLGSLTGCASWRAGDGDVRYYEDFSTHEPLRVQGYPSAGSLRLVQEVVWRLGDGDEGKLASLASSDSSPGEATKVARGWIAEFHQGARGQVTAAFCSPGDGREALVLTFHDTGQTKALHVRLDGNGGEDGWRVRMREAEQARGETPERLPQCT